MIIGITGTLGAGKGTIVRHLIEHHGYKHYSVREFLNREVARRGMSLNRDSQVAVANELRSQYGSEYIVKMIMEKALKDGGKAVIESIRAVGEAEYLKSHGALLWAVDADIKIRYERIRKRNSETDAISYEKFAQDEGREYKNSDPKKQSLSEVIAMSDILFYNNGKEGELIEKVRGALQSRA